MIFLRALSLILFTLLFAGCTSYFLNNDQKNQTHLLFEELRQEIVELKHALKSNQVSLELLEEKFQDQEHSLTSLKYQASAKNPKTEQIALEINTLEQRVDYLEKFREKVDQMLQKVHECENELAMQKLRLEDISKLKATLSSISQVMQQNAASIKHKVKAGDTLDKIAKYYHINIASLKKQNRLNDDRILIGDELEIPHE
jgi:LysM repeat protein